MKTDSMPYKGPLRKLMRDLYRVLGKHNRYDARGKKVVSFATQQQRQNVLEIFMRELYTLGYKPENVRSLKEKHIAAVLDSWEQRFIASEKMSASTLTTRISILRTFFSWIGKQGILDDPTKYLKEPTAIKRTLVSNVDKTWSGQGIDINAKLEEVDKKDPVVGLQFRLQAAFGLRPREAWLLKPHMADKNTHLVVAWGTKGGRSRANVLIDTQDKRDLIDLAKQLAPNLQDSTIPKEHTLKTWRRHFYYVCERCGITRNDGITAHGLRHEYANGKYQELTGFPSLVKGGDKSQVDPDRDNAVRLDIAEDLGHGRAVITGAYIGGRRKAQ